MGVNVNSKKSHDWVASAKDSTMMIEKCAKNLMIFCSKNKEISKKKNPLHYVIPEIYRLLVLLQ